MKRWGWIAAALGLSMSAAAQAQQADDGQEKSQEGGAQKQPDTDTQALQRQSQTDQMQEQTSTRLSRVEQQGIELSSLDEDQVKEVQRSLQEAGYYSGTLDGVAGGATRQALSRFYRDQATLASQGKILPQAAGALGLEEADIERVSGKDEAEQPPSESQQGSEKQPAQREQQQPSQQQQNQPMHEPTHDESVPHDESAPERYTP